MKNQRKKGYKWRPERERLLDKLVVTENRLIALENEFKLKFGIPWPEYENKLDAWIDPKSKKKEAEKNPSKH